MCVSFCQTLPQQSDSTTEWELRARINLVSLAVSLNRGFPQTPSESSHQLFLDVQFATWLKWSSFSSLIALTNWDLVPAPTYSAWGFSSLTSIFFRAMTCCAYFFLDSLPGSEICRHLFSNRVFPYVPNSSPQIWGQTSESILTGSKCIYLNCISQLSALSLLFHTVGISPPTFLQGFPETVSIIIILIQLCLYMVCSVELVSLNLQVITAFHQQFNVNIDQVRFSTETPFFVLIKIILWIHFLINTDTSLYRFLDVDVEGCAPKSAEETYGEITNLNTVLYERIFLFKIYW